MRRVLIFGGTAEGCCAERRREGAGCLYSHTGRPPEGAGHSLEEILSALAEMGSLTTAIAVFMASFPSSLTALRS